DRPRCGRAPDPLSSPPSFGCWGAAATVYPYPRPPSRRALHGKLGSDQPGPLLHHPDAEVACRSGHHLLHPETAPVIRHLQLAAALRREAEEHPHLRGAGMAADVKERLLDDAKEVKRLLHAAGILAAARGDVLLHVHGYPILFPYITVVLHPRYH